MFTTPPFLQEASHLSPLLASRAFLRALTLALDLSADLASTSLSYLDKASFNRFARASGVFVGSPGTGRAGQSIMSFCTWSAAETACSRSRSLDAVGRSGLSRNHVLRSDGCCSESIAHATCRVCSAARSTRGTPITRR